MAWHLQDAKNNFSKVVLAAQREGPQEVTVRGVRTAVIISVEDYDALRRQRPSLADHLLAGPTWDDDMVEAVNRRTKAPSRKVAF